MEKKQAELLLDTRPIFASGGTPCGAIDRAIAQLKEGQDLVLLVPFEPAPLYTKLAQHGLGHHAQELEDGTWQIRFSQSLPIDSTPAAGSHSCSCS